MIQTKQRKKFSTWAIVGFIISFLSFFSVIGIGLSIYGLIDTKKNNKRGKGLAIAGIIIGGIVFIVTITNPSSFQQLDITTQEKELSQVSSQQESLITKSPEEMLPGPRDLPTEYKIGEKEDVLKNSSVIALRNAQEGFDYGKTLSISKYKLTTVSAYDYIEVTFGIYKFTNSDYASNFKNTIINEIKNEGGYTELSVSADTECFAWKQDYGFESKLGDSVCNNKNVVFWISVSMANTNKQPDSYVKDMTEIADEKVK